MDTHQIADCVVRLKVLKVVEMCFFLSVFCPCGFALEPDGNERNSRRFKTGLVPEMFGPHDFNIGTAGRNLNRF